ncbi:Secreted chorismate mutase precursor [Variovorax sp. PBS-H4]|nr:Secreted chorismate mutase precursor [Variovorax sp. PBS-H4]
MASESQVAANGRSADDGIWKIELKSKLLKLCQAAVPVAVSALGGLPLAVAHAAGADAKDFSRLVELSATRLEISRKVALTKWDTKMPIADPPNDPREKQVIDAASAEAKGVGLSSDLASAFFSDQIEASKLIQFVLMSDWARSGKVPTEHRADLKAELRPALDRLRTQFIQELIATHKLREAPDCKAQLVKASGAYGARQKLSPLYTIALDRGLARVCGD